MKKLKSYIKLMRPKQWVKNGFVFGALIFSNSFLDLNLIIRSLTAFFAFCLASSTVYVLNDIVDIDKDKVHPKKCKRPLASGAMKIYEAKILGLILMTISIILTMYLDIKVTMIILIYFVNNIFYSFKLKNIVIVDVFSIAVGFVLRVMAGAMAIDVIASSWILLCTLFISLFLGFGKRKGEIVLLKGNANDHRKILTEYNLDFLNSLINVVFACTIVFYAIYTVIGGHNEYMVFTTIFVAYGIFRYNYLLNEGEGNSPTDIVTSDKHLIIDIILWVISCIFITIYK